MTYLYSIVFPSLVSVAMKKDGAFILDKHVNSSGSILTNKNLEGMSGNEDKDLGEMII